MGVDNSSVHSAPFEIVGKESFSMITNLTPDANVIKDAKNVKKLSVVLSSRAFYVAKKADEEDIEGVPVLLESELPDIETSRELTKRIKRR